MPVSIDLVESQVFTVVRQDFLLAVLPSGVEVVQGQGNRVPPPKSGDYVVMYPLSKARLGTNVETWDLADPAPTGIHMLTSMQCNIQLDVHGPNSADYTSMIAMLARSAYACDLFAASGLAIQPLYCEEPRQLAFVSGAQQVEDRWCIDLALQMNINLTVSQDFANTLVVGLLNVDTGYPKPGQFDFSDPYQSGLLPLL